MRNVAQLSLFEATESVLVDDERGRIVYTPDWISISVAEAWFAALRESVEWQAQRRLMYDREVDVPRLSAHFDLAEPLPPSLRDAADRIAATTGVPFNSVGLNRYRDGNDCVAPHNDHLDTLMKDQPIALVSLGATRRMAIRRKAPPQRTLNLALAAGSLLLMSYATQIHYTHGIPKTTEPVGERVSLAAAQAIVDLLNGRQPQFMVNPEVCKTPQLRGHLRAL
jgi:alkylated DNA repair dioxygenase AlkB